MCKFTFIEKLFTRRKEYREYKNQLKMAKELPKLISETMRALEEEQLKVESKEADALPEKTNNTGFDKDSLKVDVEKLSTSNIDESVKNSKENLNENQDQNIDEQIR